MSKYKEHLTEVREDLRDLYYDMIEEDNAHLIAIDGQIGTGKTSLFCLCADIINKLDMGEDTEFMIIDSKTVKKELEDHDQLSMGGSQFMQYLEKGRNKIKALGYDEAGDFSKRRSLSKKNVDLLRSFEKFRANKIIVFLITPNFWNIDRSLVDGQYITMLLHCYGKSKKDGYSRIKVYDPDGINDLYNLWYPQYKNSKFKKINTKFEAYEKVEPVYRDFFYDLPKEEAEKLALLSTLQKAEDTKGILIEHYNLMTYDEIAQHFKRSKIWAKKKILKLGIPERFFIKGRKYFSKDILELLK